MKPHILLLLCLAIAASACFIFLQANNLVLASICRLFLAALAPFVVSFVCYKEFGDRIWVAILVFVLWICGYTGALLERKE